MSTYQFAMVLGTIYIAPHVPERAAFFIGLIVMLLGLLSAWLK